MSQNEHLTDVLYDYITAHNPPADAVVRELVEETAAMGSVSSMQLGLDQAAFLGFMVGLLEARFVVEIGTFTGLSSLAMARALPESGRILCCDISEDYTHVARRYWEKAGVADRITLEIGPALETLAKLRTEPVIDLAFVDADKEGYIDYYEALVPRLSPRGVIIADNLFMGSRAVERDGDGSAGSISAFADHIQSDPRTETVLVSIGDGFSMTRLV